MTKKAKQPQNVRPKGKLPKPKAKTAQPVHSQHLEDLCSITDPFCPHAKHGKIPDSGAGTSFTEQVRWDYTLSSNANGDFAFQFTPEKANNPYSINDGITGNYDAWTGDNASLVKNSGDAYRTVTAGIKAISLLSAVDSKGSLALARGRSQSSVAIETSPDFYETYELMSVGPTTEFTMISKPYGAEAHDFQNVANFSGTQNPLDNWDALFILGTGLPTATAVLRIEIVINYEFFFSSADLLRKLQTPQPIYSPAMMTARNQVQSDLHSVVKGGKALLANHVKDHAKKAIVKHVIPYLAKSAAKLLV